MKRPWTLAALTLLALPLVRLEAQERMFRVYGTGDRHARLGVTVDAHADPKRDKLGAEIEEVVPDGPADQAGLKEGDIITKFNDTALGGVKAEDEDESGPGRKLIELAHKLEPGDTVKLEYLRDGKTRQATVVAERLGRGFARVELPEMPELPGMPDLPRFRFNAEPDHFEMLLDGAVGGIELVSLNPDLGEYFGAKEGVLVVKSPGDSTLALKGGDVIVAIDGRKPQSPSHALRILRSYAAGETVKLDVLRQKKRTTVSWAVPEGPKEQGRKPMRMRVHREEVEQGRT